jgi:hypothetical protein
MNRKKRIYLLIILITFTLSFLCGCNKEASSNSNTVVTCDGCTYSKNGVIIYEDGLLAYYDYRTGERSVICSRPECTHQKYNSQTNPDPSCAAVPPKQTIFEAAIIINDYLYMFVLPSEINKMDIYRSDLDGENRIKVGQVNCGGINGAAIVYENFFIFTGRELTKKDNEDELSVSVFLPEYFTGILDINTLELVHIETYEKHRISQSYYVYNNILYYYYMDEDVYEIRRVNLSDFTVIEPLSLPMKNEQDKAYCVMDKGHMYYVKDNPTLLSSDIRRIDLTTLEDEVFISGIEIQDGYLIGISDKYFFIHCNVSNVPEVAEWKFIIYDSDKKQLNECDMLYSGTQTAFATHLINLDDEYILLYKFDEGSEHASYRYMKIESLINKSYDFVDTDVIY